jgi:hypothetical protein
VAGLVGRHLPSLGGCPNPRQPVPQIQRITNQPARRAIRHLKDAAEFGGCEVGDGGGAVPAQPDRMLGAGQPTVGDGVAGLQVGPVGGELQPSGFGGDQGVFVGLGCSESGGGIQLDQIIFEHAFNIWLESDTFLRFSASRPTDNTSPIQTTPATAKGRRLPQPSGRPRLSAVSDAA